MKHCPYCQQELVRFVYSQLIVKCQSCSGQPEFLDWNALVDDTLNRLVKSFGDYCIFRFHMKHLFWVVYYFPQQSMTMIQYSTTNKNNQKDKTLVRNFPCPLLTPKNAKSFLKKMIKLKMFL